MSAARLCLSAWVDPADGDGLPAGTVSGDVPNPARWALRSLRPFAPEFLAPVVVEPRDWRDPAVGWGVVLRDGAPVPPPIRQLIDARGGAPVFRYLPGTSVEYVCLRNYAAGKDVAIEGAPSRSGPDALPTYLLIYGSPQDVPWRLQYVLNTTRCVGRLHLTGDALQHYVDALLGWDAGREPVGAAGAAPGEAVVWAVTHGPDDITQLMRDAIAGPLAERLGADAQLRVRFVDGNAEPATAASLRAALVERRPGLVVTTSHGRTGPLRDPAAMAAALGLPVAADGAAVAPDALLDAWQPAGAVWYAHACCSAGSDGASNFAGLFGPDTPAAAVLDAVAKLGPQVAPLPTALLGAERPLRAFVGHVEPTFDWTLRLPATGQHLTTSLVDALYTRLYVAAAPPPPQQALPPAPVGYAFRSWYGRTAGLEAQRRAVERAFGSRRPTLDDGQDVGRVLLATALAARDLESTVILGDPTVAVPPLA